MRVVEETAAGGGGDDGLTRCERGGRRSQVMARWKRVAAARVNEEESDVVRWRESE